MKFLVFALLAGISSLLVTGCGLDDVASPDQSALGERSSTTLIGYVPNTPLVGLTAENELVTMVSGPPARETSRVPITGLRDGEFILAIDTRPLTRGLYGISSESFLYQLDATTGEAVPVSLEPLSPAVNGSLISFDFNPADDIIRLTTETGQNLRISPFTGAVVGVDVPFNFGQSVINASAYSYRLGYERSVFFGINMTEGTLYRSSGPNSGVLQYVGSLGYDLLGEGGFEITSANTAYTVQLCKGRAGNNGALDSQQEETYRMLLLNLKTGQATDFGQVKPLIGLAQGG